jgi:hypothetical protein
MVLQALDLAFSLACIKAGRTQMPVIEFHVAQGAQKPPANGTWYHRPFLGVIKTAGLIVHQQGLGRWSRCLLPEEGGKDIHLHDDAARGTLRQGGPVKGQGCLAFGTCSHRSFS